MEWLGSQAVIMALWQIIGIIVGLAVVASNFVNLTQPLVDYGIIQNGKIVLDNAVKPVEQMQIQANGLTVIVFLVVFWFIARSIY